MTGPTPTPTQTPIPTVSQWGLIVMGLLMLTMGGVVILCRQSGSA